MYFGALWCTLVYFGEPRNCSPGLKIIRDGRNYYANKKIVSRVVMWISLLRLGLNAKYRTVQKIKSITCMCSFCESLPQAANVKVDRSLASQSGWLLLVSLLPTRTFYVFSSTTTFGSSQERTTTTVVHDVEKDTNDCNMSSTHNFHMACPTSNSIPIPFIFDFILHVAITLVETNDTCS